MLLVEQNVQVSLAISDFAYVLDRGRVTVAGDARAVRAMPDVRRAYLGL